MSSARADEVRPTQGHANKYQQPEIDHATDPRKATRLSRVILRPIFEQLKKTGGDNAGRELDHQLIITSDTAPNEPTATMPIVMNPDARTRSDPADAKEYLEFDCKAGQGVLASWNLNTEEYTFPIFRYVKQPDGTGKHVAMEITHAAAVQDLYFAFKIPIVKACKVYKYRGGAFAEVVNSTSPLDDIMQIIYWSPLMTKEHRWIFKILAIRPFTSIVSALKNPDENRDFDSAKCAEFAEVASCLENFFKEDFKNPPPIPTDVSPAWRKEFGEAFEKDYYTSLIMWRKGEKNAPLQLAIPIRDKDGMSKLPTIFPAKLLTSYSHDGLA